MRKLSFILLMVFPMLCAAGFFYSPARQGVNYGTVAASTDPTSIFDYVFDSQTMTVPVVSPGYTNFSTWTNTRGGIDLKQGGSQVNSNSARGVLFGTGTGGNQYLTNAAITISSNNPYTIFFFAHVYWDDSQSLTTNTSVVWDNGVATGVYNSSNRPAIKVNGTLGVFDVKMTNINQPSCFCITSLGGTNPVLCYLNKTNTGLTLTSFNTNIVLTTMGANGSTATTFYGEMMYAMVATNRFTSVAEFSNAFVYCCTNGNHNFGYTNVLFHVTLTNLTGNPTDLVSSVVGTIANTNNVKATNNYGPRGSCWHLTNSTGINMALTNSVNGTHSTFFFVSFDVGAAQKADCFSKFDGDGHPTGVGWSDGDIEGTIPSNIRATMQVGTGGTNFYEPGTANVQNAPGAVTTNFLFRWHSIGKVNDDSAHTGFQYIDGAPNNSTPARTLVGTNSIANAGAIVIGNTSAGEAPLNGYICDIIVQGGIAPPMQYRFNWLSMFCQEGNIL